MSDIKSSLYSGALSGIAGLLVFLVIHQFWILPIWFILPLGLPIAALGGLAAGWAYHELRPSLPRRPWTALAWVALVSLTLAPSIVIAELRPPVYIINGDQASLTVSKAQLLSYFITDLLLSATLVGGLAGWLLVRTRRATGASALAGFIFALGPGHNIPFLGHTPGLAKGTLLLFAVVVSASFVLVAAHAFLGRMKLTSSPQPDHLL